MWLSKQEYQRLLDQVACAEQRATDLLSALELERHENREAERHWANMLLRAKASYPLPVDKPAEPKPTLPVLEPVVDEGEYEALVEAAAAAGFQNPEEEAKRVIRGGQ